MFTLVFSLHFASCLFMTGLIWLIQLVHYPSFHFIERRRFKEFEEFHSRRITHIVLPIMALELITAAALVVFSFRGSGLQLSLGNAASVGAIWIFTLLVSARLHQQLLRGDYSAKKVDRLIQTNWVRTLLWTARSAALIASILLHST